MRTITRALAEALAEHSSSWPENEYWGGTGELDFTSPPSRPCPHCEKSFQSPDDLRKHIIIDHPTKYPVIFIGDERGIEDEENTINAPISKNKIELRNVDEIEVSKNGKGYTKYTSADLEEELARAKSAHYSIILKSNSISGHPLEKEYIFNVKIPDEEELEYIDERFANILATHDVTMSDVSRFGDQCKDCMDAADYSSALADYVIGVLIKDRNPDSGISRPFSEYKEKMESALHTLRHFDRFDRPVPLAICASIKFNLNNFREPRLCGIDLLDAANRYYHHVARNITIQCPKFDKRKNGTQELPAYPIDQDSYSLLSIFQKIRSQASDEELITELSALTADSELSEYDRSKKKVLYVLVYNRAKDKKKEQEALKELIHDQAFGKWAESQLKGGGK